MPELPEVEALARFLDARLRENTIARLDVIGVATLKTVSPTPATFSGALVSGVHRRGKFIVVVTDRGIAALHLARAGWIRWGENQAAGRPSGRSPIAARLVTADGAGFDATEQGHEKRLSLWLAEADTDIPGIARLGPEPLDAGFTVTRLQIVLRDHGDAHLKTVLADQSAIAGIGNAYSDEILHAARLSPFTAASRLDEAQIAALHRSITGVLGAALAATAGLAPAQLKDAKRTAMAVHGRTGLPCPVCGDTIRQVDTGRKVFQYCPRCQTGGRIHADRRLSRLGIRP